MLFVFIHVFIINTNTGLILWCVLASFTASCESTTIPLMKYTLVLAVFLFALAVSQEYSMGTLEQPKADLPVDAELVIQNIVILGPLRLQLVHSWRLHAKGSEGKYRECTLHCSLPSLNVIYKGYLYKNGKKFDSSFDRNTPFSLKLGAGRVIRGWEEGLLGMCPGYSCEYSVIL